MKKIISSTCLLIFYSCFAFAQESTPQITKILDANRVKINIGEQQGVSIDDTYQVLGKGQIIHAATGRLIERDNVYFATISVIEVNTNSAVAVITDKTNEVNVGYSISKLQTSQPKVVVQQEQARYVPKETVTQKSTISTSKSRDNFPRITKVYEENNQLFGLVDKGSASKVRGGKPRVGKKYLVLIPVVDTSSVTGQTHVSGEKLVGSAHLKSVDHDASVSKLSVQEKRVNLLPYEGNITLKSYIAKDKGIHHIIRLSTNIIHSPLIGGFDFINGYQFSPYYFLGISIGYNKSGKYYFWWLEDYYFSTTYTDYGHSQTYYDYSYMKSTLFYVYQKVNFWGSKSTSLSFNSGFGQARSNLENSINTYTDNYNTGWATYNKIDVSHDNRYFLLLGLGVRRHIKNFGTATLDFEISNWTSNIKLGFEFYSSPFNQR